MVAHQIASSSQEKRKENNRQVAEDEEAKEREGSLGQSLIARILPPRKMLKNCVDQGRVVECSLPTLNDASTCDSLSERLATRKREGFAILGPKYAFETNK